MSVNDVNVVMQVMPVNDVNVSNVHVPVNVALLCRQSRDLPL